MLTRRSWDVYLPFTLKASPQCCQILQYTGSLNTLFTEHVLNFVLHNDTAKSSGCSISNVWLMCDELMGEGNKTAVLFRLTTSQSLANSIPDGSIGIFHWHHSSCGNMEQGSTKRYHKLVPGTFLRAKVMTNFPPSYADCLEISEL
jgi:hypothetical protein